MENNSEYSKGGLINNFLWICSGVNVKLVRQCPTEWAKYAGQGGLILFTALMAMLSGGYAFSTIFKNVPISIGFGIFWGLLIFNLDRFIVNTMYSDGKHTISGYELLAGLPRIIIAIFLGIVISTPLEMKIFEDRINWQIEKDNESRRELSEDNVDVVKRQKLDDEYAALVNRRKELEEKLDEASRALAEEGEGNALSGRAGRGPIYREKEIRKNDAQKALDNFDMRHGSEMDFKQQQIKETQKNIDDEREKRKKFEENTGFCVRYEAFANLKKDNDAVRLVSIFIMLMFIIIEVSPTFFKMMVASGPYDDLLAVEKIQKQTYRAQIEAEQNDNLAVARKISEETAQEKIKMDVESNKKILQKLSDIQSEILDTAIEEWRKTELENAKKSPSSYISKSE